MGLFGILFYNFPTISDVFSSWFNMTWTWTSNSHQLKSILYSYILLSIIICTGAFIFFWYICWNHSYPLWLKQLTQPIIMGLIFSSYFIIGSCVLTSGALYFLTCFSLNCILWGYLLLVFLYNPGSLSLPYGIYFMLKDTLKYITQNSQM